jgi:hypothetical protein
MNRHRLPRLRRWMALVAVIGLIAIHLLLGYGLSHAAVPAAVASGAIVLIVIKLIVIKHLGLLGPLYAWFRARSRH